MEEKIRHLDQGIRFLWKLLVLGFACYSLCVLCQALLSGVVLDRIKVLEEKVEILEKRNETEN